MTLKKALIGAFVLSWLLLLAWAFQDVRVFVRVHIAHFLGWHAGVVPEQTSEAIALHEFQPRAQLIRESTDNPQKPAFPVFEFHGHIFPGYEGNLTREMDDLHNPMFVDLALRTTTVEKFDKLREKYPDPRVLIFPGLNYDRLKEDGDPFQKMAADLEALARDRGVKGIKLWKDLGLFREYEGEIIPIDDPRLDPVWDVCVKYDLVVGIHTADPPAFFDPTDHENERFQELARRPEWSFFGEGFPSFRELLAQRDRLFKRRRDVKFVALHFGELAHDLGAARKLLEENPNVWLDTAQRIDELGRHPRAVARFFNDFQDRILYGTDGLPDRAKIEIYWRFFETDDDYFDYHPEHKPRKGFWKIHGLDLPDSVLKKLYYQNALKLLNISEAEFFRYYE